MSLRLNRLWLLPALLVASQSWALGLGDIRLSSALNEPLRAEIELLSATPEDLANLDIQLASSETFERYGIDRPLYLTTMQFDIVGSGGSSGNVIRVTTPQPVSEPFVTFLIEAIWSRGRLLREYTLLLDPPTFAPPPTRQSNQPVAAPSRSTPADSGTIQRPAPQPAAAAPTPAARPSAPAPSDNSNFNTTAGGNYQVQRGDTLWAIAERVRPDNRLNMNQTMIGIYEANQHAFAGNINRLSAGASLRIPSADEIFRISRGDAASEVSRQTQAWSSGTQAGPSLRLVPPESQDAGFSGTVSPTSSSDGDAAAQQRIRELERTIADQESLLEIRDTELANLREELARLRSEQPIPDGAPDLDEPVADDEMPVDDAIPIDDDGIFAEDDTAVAGADDEGPAVDEADSDDEAVAPVAEDRPAPRVVSSRPEPSLIDTILGYVTSIWGLIGAALIVVLGILVWFARRAGRDEEDSTGVWDALDADDVDSESLASTERLRALARDDDDSIVVVEQGSKPRTVEPEHTATVDALEAVDTDLIMESDQPAPADTDTSRSLEDTFSSETAINLDQSDPVAEADFHMAYGLYDQAADLINGALTQEPDRQDLLAKLSEIYFVWGNRDGFVEAAQRLRAQIGDDDDGTWDKVVIMGQQIAGDHELFSGATAGGATRAVDLSFDSDMDGEGGLDIDFASSGEDGLVSDVIDLGADSGEASPFDTEASSIDFPFGEDDTTSASFTAEMPNPSGVDEADSPTVESFAPEADDEPMIGDETAASMGLSGADNTVETPTIEQQFESLEATSELPALSADDAAGAEIASLDEDRPPIDSTAEINLDDLGLNLDELSKPGFADALMDDDATGESAAFGLDDPLDISDEAIADNFADATGKNPQVESLPESTGVHAQEDLASDLASTSEVPGLHDRTGQESWDDDLHVDTSLLDATGQTQVLSDEIIADMADEEEHTLSDEDRTMLAPGIDDDADAPLADDAATLHASLDDDDDDEFDFAKTEALPADTYSGPGATDETGEIPGLAGATDMDLDLDDLTAALKVSALGDTIDQPRDDATVEQPRFREDDEVDLDIGTLGPLDDDGPTQALSPDEVSADLHDARTMTEVGTKLDLARAYVDMGDPAGARSILQEVLDEGDEGQRQQAQQLLDTLPS